MTADTEARNDVVGEVPKGDIEIEDECGLDMSSYEDLPKLGGGPDCNGNVKHAQGTPASDDDDVTAVHANGGSGKDDTDDSYVFVTGTDEVTADPADSHVGVIVPNSDVEVPASELSLENGGTDYLVNETASDELSFERSLGEAKGEKVDGAEAEALHLDCGVKVEEDQMESASTSDPPQVTALESIGDSNETQELTIVSSGARDMDAKPEEVQNLDSGVELGAIQTSQTAISEADGFELTNSNVREVKLEEQPKVHLDEQVEESLESSLAASTESVDCWKEEHGEEKTCVVIGVDENQESLIVAPDNAQSELNPEQEAVSLPNETSATIEMETGSDPVSCEYGAALTEEVSSCVNEGETVTQLIESVEEARVLPSADHVRTESEVGDMPAENGGSDPVSCEYGAALTEEVSSCINKGETVTQLIESVEEAQILPSANHVRTETEVGDMPVEDGGSEPVSCEYGAALTEEVSSCINEGETVTQLIESVEEAQVLPSADHVRTESEIGDMPDEDGGSEPVSCDHGAAHTEDVRSCVNEGETVTQLNESIEEARVLPTADDVRSVSENGDVPVEDCGSNPVSCEHGAAKTQEVSSCVNEGKTVTHLNKCVEEAHVLPSAEHVKSESESEDVSVEGGGSHPVSCDNKAAQTEEGSSSVNNTETGTQLNGSSEEAQILPSAGCVRSESEIGDVPIKNDGGTPISCQNRDVQTEINSSVNNCETGTLLNESFEETQLMPYPAYVRSESEIGVVAVLVKNDGSFLVHPNDAIELQQEGKCGASLITENVPTSSTDDSINGAEIENLDVENSKSGVGYAQDNSKSEIEAKDVPARGGTTLNFPAEHVSFGTVIEFGSIGRAPIYQGGDLNSELLVSKMEAEPDCCAKDLDHDHDVIDSNKHGSHHVVKLASEVESSYALRKKDVPINYEVVPISENLDGSDTSTESALNSVLEDADGQNVRNPLNGAEITDVKANCQETEDNDAVQSDGITTSSLEGSTSDAIDGQNVETETLARPFNFLLRIPLIDDENLKEQIRQAWLQVEEKTRRRDAFQAEIQAKRANCQAHGQSYEAAKSEEKAVRLLVKSKRQEIDNVQSVINRMKNAISVEDIDGRIYTMEHMIQHETLPLKEEKQFIREIKQLKHLREQLSSNMITKEELQQTLVQKDQMEDRLKNLRKELESLKDRVSKAEAAGIAAGKKFDDESRRIKELQVQSRAANVIRQESYAHFLRLKSQLNEKNKNFRMYKDDVKVAKDFASRGDKEALNHLCFNQVEKFMELWNTNDEFRKEYARYTVRRFRTLDGRSLNPDEEPPVLPSYVKERVDRRLVSIPSQTKSISQVPTVEEEKPVGDKEVGGTLMERLAKQKDLTAKSEEIVKPILSSGLATVSGRDEALEDRKEEEKMQTKEEQELARKAEESRKAELAAKLKELRRLEEKAKAKEALERKKRNAEKAQMRAELRARKEAEQKEKEREKRLRKKGKKKESPGEAHDGYGNGEDGPATESSTEATTKESDAVKESQTTTTKKPQKPLHYFSKQSKPKPLPPPLCNRGKKRMQQWLRLIFAAVVVLALFLLGNTGFFLNLRLQKAAGSF